MAPESGKHYDVIVIGAGPAGLSLALSLAALGLRIGVLELQGQKAVEDPPDDGREIALTHQSMQILGSLGVDAGWSDDEISELRSARVYNGGSARFLDFQGDPERPGPLGFLVANRCIRRELYRRAACEDRIELLFGRRVSEYRVDTDRIAVRTDADGWLSAFLLVAADSRHSETRRALGVAARMHDFGRTMLVARVSHTRPHLGSAMEWFDYGRTIATLPLCGQRSSVVLTVPGTQAEGLAALGSDRFEARLEQWLGGRLGQLHLCSGVHRYPLVAVYADRFVGQRFALIGDAAVGMHPVTAHGFNFGLSGQALLRDAIALEMRFGGDIGSGRVLGRYERLHRRRTWPLYQATNAIAKLYSNETPPARLARTIALGLGQQVAPFKHAIVEGLRGDRAIVGGILDLG